MAEKWDRRAGERSGPGGGHDYRFNVGAWCEQECFGARFENTVLRRYAPGSVKFDDATAAPIDQIKAGDQLRARGQKSADGGELTADEVVSGSFRNISGTINSIDAANNTITVQDLVTKKPVIVRISQTVAVAEVAGTDCAEDCGEVEGRFRIPPPAGTNRPAVLPGGAGSATRRLGAGFPALEQRAAKRRCAARTGWPGPEGWHRPRRCRWTGRRLAASNLKDAPPPTYRLQKGDAVMIVATSDNSGGVGRRGGDHAAVGRRTHFAGITQRPSRS